MDDYLLLVEDDPTMSDEDFLYALKLYGFNDRKAKLTVMILRAFGKAPAGHSDHDLAMERQAFLRASDINSEIVYTNKVPYNVFGRWSRDSQ